MYLTIAIVALFGLALLYGYEQYAKGKAQMAEDKFEPEEIGDLSPKKGDMLECTESYGDFTKGHNYIVRVEYGGALVVWNDEGKFVLAAGLDPRKFRVAEENVDGTAAMPAKQEEEL